MRAFKVIAAIALAAVVLVGGGLALREAGIDNPVSQATDQAGQSAANAALDAIGIKGKANEMLHENAGRIAEATGIPKLMVDRMIDELDIESWQLTTLPKSATPTGTTTVDYNGTKLDLTIYDDPSVVTVGTDMGDITLAVPSSVQGTISFLKNL